ncbi:MAG TPA: hypothetical protein VFK03_04365 [Candidatus Saccharimonadales bacterium]|nr:hypothetical protein [Candidatus Saccharimonadales bacterium]
MSSAGVVIVGAAAFGAYSYLGSDDQAATTEPTISGQAPPTTPEPTPKSEAGDQQKQQFISDKQNSQTPSPQEKSQTSLLITHNGQDGDTLQLRVLISAVTNGTCQLTMTQSGQPAVTKQVDIQPMANNSTCKGFDVDTSDMAKGEWNYTIKISSSDYYGSVKDKVYVS